MTSTGSKVGRQSAGTNGNITGVQLPGAFAFSFTGMKVTHADGSPFLGLGIVPDVDVKLSAAAFREVTSLRQPRL